MKVMIVSDRPKELKEAEAIMEKACAGHELVSFKESPAALAHAREDEIDTAIIKTDMPELTGLDLGRYLKDLNPHINLIFWSDSRKSAYDAIALHASGYLLSPLAEEAVRGEMNDLRYPEEHKKHKRVFAQTFGDFELFVDGKPVIFKYTRTKEVVAILINNRGAQTTNGEIIACLWEDEGDPEKKASYLGNLRQDLQNTLTKLKLNGIIIKQRGSMAIATDKIDCDLFDWLEKKKDSQYHYMGDYMNQYSWPEYRHAELDEISYALYDD